MDEQIEDLFIVKESLGKQAAQSQARRALRFGRITQEGSVVIDDKSLSKGDQLKLCLIIRFIASCLDEKIDMESRPSELTQILDQRLEAIGSSLSKLVKEGFAKKGGHGKYSVFPYRINSFLDQLEEQQSPTTTSQPIIKTGVKRKKKAFSGIGAHIQRLVDDGFFSVPRFMSEIVSRLEEENVFRDAKVIDRTIRETFVLKQRVLQKVRNVGGGKATWKYVLRK